MTRTYSIPHEPRFAPLRDEAKHYLQPSGFSEGPPGHSTFHLAVLAGEKEDESYTLERMVKNGKTTISIRAQGTRGAAHGFHHVLQLLGFGFSFFADARPQEIVLRWPFAGKSVQIRPEFSARGFLPWHNFLNGPTTWNEADYRRHLLTLWRWGGNTVIFRNDRHEPLVAMRNERGKWILGRKMATSIDAPWGGTKGIPLSQFAHGTGKFFKDAQGESWGAQHAFAKDPIQAAQDEFAEACRFGKSIGVDMAFGIESLGEDPTTPGIKELLRKRIAHILRAYPDLHTLCCWHPEGNGQRGWAAAAGSPGYATVHRKYEKAFRYMNSATRRVADAVRTADWFMFVYEAAREIRPSIKIAFAGWGGDKWMRWGDYWKGLHEILPADITLAQLDNINPLSQEGVSRSVVGISGQRTLWSIPWVESDGSSLGRSSQWHPQDDVSKMKSLARSAQKLGYDGLLGIHWQTAGAELNAACLAAAGWNTSEPAETFYLHYAQTFFSPKVEEATRVAKILTALETLGPGWSGTGQQTECSTFDWDPFPAVTLGPLFPELELIWKNLEKSRDALFASAAVDFKVYCSYDAVLFSFNQRRSDPSAVEKLGQLRKDFAALKLKQPHARRWLATMDFVIAYEHIRRELMSGGKLKMQQQLLKEAAELGLKPDPSLAANYKKGLVRIEALWKKVFAAQASRLDTPGDLGNLANLNLKAYQAWIKFQDEKMI
jgi:hypothetical protein